MTNVNHVFFFNINRFASMAGRKLDNIWIHYNKINLNTSSGTSLKAECKKCRYQLSALVARMKRHHEKCAKSIDSEVDEIEPFSSPTASTSKSTCSVLEVNDVIDLALPVPPKKVKSNVSLSNFIIKTTKEEKIVLDEMCARFIYATNLPFRVVDHKEFKQFCEKLRPGYTPPDRKTVGNHLLEKVNDDLEIQSSKQLEKESVSLSIDGWTNISSEAIICCTLTNDDGTLKIKIW